MRTVVFVLSLALLLPAAVPADTENYDRHLCRTAQRLIINADDSLPVVEQRGTSNGFHTIQMNIDAERRAAVIAMTTHYAEYDGLEEPTYIACKMVNRQRVNNVLHLDLPDPDRECAEVNQLTYELALTQLSDADRQRYMDEGRRLSFASDVIIATGGEWLPITMDAFVTTMADGSVSVHAPSVRVPWNAVEKNFFQGTQHCKLVSLSAMNRWVTEAAFDPDATLLPLTDTACTAPHSMHSQVGSCLFYFAPADAMFCQDYSGAQWNTDTAQAECGDRHASKAALAAVKNRYDGDGGIFSPQSCADRPDSPHIAGTCVFNCKAGDETLWHVTGAIDPRMTRGCDLFIER